MTREISWERCATCPDVASASVAVAYLERNGCPAMVVTVASGSDAKSSAEVLVPADLLHRARWLWAQVDVSNLSKGELEYLMTGTLPGTGELPPSDDAV
jgi:hypothetical protein